TWPNNDRLSNKFSGFSSPPRSRRVTNFQVCQWAAQLFLMRRVFSCKLRQRATRHTGAYNRPMNSVFCKKSSDIFDPFMDHSESFLLDPYPTLEGLRSGGPVIWSQRGNHWLITGFDEAHNILRSKSFNKRIEDWKHPNVLMRPVLKFLRSFNKQSIILQDPPEHTRVRGLMNKAFTPSAVHRLEPHIQQLTDGLIDEFISRGKADLIAEFAFPLPVTVIAELLGVDAADRSRFKEWSTLITASLRGSVCPYRAAVSLKATLELRQYLREVIATKLRMPH